MLSKIGMKFDGGKSPQPIDNVGKLSLSRRDKKTVRFYEQSWRR
jgi:hypothetical protein